MQSIGAFLDKLILFSVGIYFIFLSYKNKEKLGDKAAKIRLGGILLVAVGVILTIVHFFK